MSRTPIPKETSEKLLYKNRHTCCVCREFRKHVQIHHIDSNSSNNESENLAVLCLDCHSLITGNEGLGRSYSQNEVKLYKNSWEKLCKVWLENNNSSIDENDETAEETENEEQVIDSDYIDEILKANTHIQRRYEMESGDGLLLWVKSEMPVHIAVLRKGDYKNWIKDKTHLQDAYELLVEDIIERKEMFIAEEQDKYSVVIANFSTEDVCIQADISIWNFE